MHNVLIHVSEVVDRGLINTDIPQKYVDDKGDTMRTKYFPFNGGRVDGTGPSQLVDAGHCFGGHNGNGTAGGD